ncbi:6-bladed beta-propeller [Desulfopila sp. IMCC35008]|uniref:6-bladed beta-propeller n=1 Tax=Desulfopila sp. IMCC35008 TaxID=2653858 RepID=UPI0013D20D68|nr:6-bladed beta-propeller [Desulfopila sp. IMCC35008]
MKKFLLFIVPFLFLIGCASPEKPNNSLVFYPSPPLQPRLQYLLSISSEDDIRDPGNDFMDFLIGDIKSEKRIRKPYDICSTPGKIYVLDRGYKKLLVIDLEKRTFSHLEAQGLGELGEPSGIWVSNDDTKYIADMKRRQVVVFDENNNFLRSYGNNGMFDKPVDVAVYRGTLLVCDMNKNQILVLDKETGRLQKTLGTMGRDSGNFYKPTHINIDQAGNIYVNDAFNYRIQKFDQNGQFIKSFGFHGDIVGAFARPKGVDVDRNGHMYVVDSAYENTQIFDVESGRLLLYFGGSGMAPGSMFLPASVHIDYANAQYYKNFADKDFVLEYVVYVGNMFGSNKLNVYGFGHWTGPPLSGWN